MELWDGRYRDGSLAGVDLIRGQEVTDGLYHLICEVLVKHADGDFLLMQRDWNKPVFPGCFEATAGGSALKGEDALACITRELLEETGIQADQFELAALTIRDEIHSIYYSYVCVTDCDKRKIILQDEEPISFKWISEEEFVKFVNSEEMIEPQKERYLKYFKEQGWI